MAILFVFLLLFGFTGLGVESGTTSMGDTMTVPSQTARVHAVPRRGDPCSNPRWSSGTRGHKKPRPMRSCALRSAGNP
jgi:hypothetical protein